VIFKNPEKAQWLIDKAINVKCRRAEVLDVFTDVEAVPFKRGFYTVDVKFFIKVTLDFFVPNNTSCIKIITMPGLVVFDKKVILFGSEGNIKIFKSQFVEHEVDRLKGSALQQSNLPIAKVEVAEPIALNARIADLHDKRFDDSYEIVLPKHVTDSLEDVDAEVEELAMRAGDRHCPTNRVVLASVGLFSIIKLTRLVQLLIPAFDFCVPNKKCVASTDENPCEIFDTIEFPVDEFFPPQKFDFPGAVENERALLDEAEK